LSGSELALALEHWDATRRKYLLYINQQQHSDDCARYPFEKIPRRIFLDTSAINVLVKYSSIIFDGEKIPNDLEETRAIDVEALMHIFHVGARADWDLVAAKKNIDELAQTPNPTLKQILLDYGIELAGLPSSEDAQFAADFGRRLVSTHFVSALTDPADQELIGNAIGFGCDVFCTCDRRTIIRKRNQLRQMPLQILTPAEWWAHVKPWAGLWS
jgi:hypothetical protein